jgi:ribosomal protein S18 acetylase RimI-like enzyme
LKDTDISYLEVREHNYKAIKMYESFGFSSLYKRQAYYPDGEDAVVMIKSMQNGKNDGLV